MPGISSSNLAFAGHAAPPGGLHHVPVPRASETVIDWERVAEELAPIACDLGAASIRRKSRDFFWFSPVLSTQLADVAGDLVVMPKDEDELVRVVRYCVSRGLPLTPRGAGTGNYGQAMPLFGGVIVDLTAMDGIKWLKGGVARVGAGMSLMQLETEVRPQGWELRFHPSTWKTATIGGFVAGGSSGVGAINYGTLPQVGNILGLRLLTIEDEPRFIELRGPDVCKAIHAYGTTGLITEVEMALAPAMRWCEFIVSAPAIMDAVRLADRIAHADGVIKKELAPIDWGAAKYFDDFLPYMREGQPVVMAIIAEGSVEPFADLVAQAGAEIVFQRGPDDDKTDPPPLWEFCWNHTTLQALKHDRTVTYLQILFDAPDHIEKVAHMVEVFGDEVPVHLEFARVDGVVKCFGLQLVRFTSEARLEEIMRYHWSNGCPVFNPHTFVLESGGGAVADPAQFALKVEVDPYGLLNPGKMPGWSAPSGGFFSRAS